MFVFELGHIYYFFIKRTHTHARTHAYSLSLSTPLLPGHRLSPPLNYVSLKGFKKGLSAPGSRFPAHEHALGEEFLVLDGVFSDEHGDYPAGTYVRNPPGSAHTPRSAPGCDLFVKLRQMPADEDRHVRIDTGDAARQARRELLRLDLFDADYESVFLIASGTEPARFEADPAAGFEALVLAGGIETGPPPLC